MDGSCRNGKDMTVNQIRHYNKENSVILFLLQDISIKYSVNIKNTKIRSEERRDAIPP